MKPTKHYRVKFKLRDSEVWIADGLKLATLKHARKHLKKERKIFTDAQHRIFKVTEEALDL